MTSPKRVKVWAFILLAAIPSLGQTQKKQILVNIKVEAEGGGRGQGMWAQGADDLTPKETKDLTSLLETSVGNEEGIKIVPSNYPEDYIGLVVVAAKVPNGTSGSWYIASSAVVVAAKNGIDELVTHDVIAEMSLKSLARSIQFQFASLRLRSMLGLLSK